MVQIEVLVKDKETGLERTLTYKSFLDLSNRYELIGQIDEAGNLIPGNPNLQPRHQTQAPKEGVVHAGEGAGKQVMKDVIPVLEHIPKEEKQEIIERKKPGPKPKVAA